MWVLQLSTPQYAHQFCSTIDFFHLQIRNLTRLIWVNVSLQPSDNDPAPPGKGKTAGSHLNAAQLTKRKTDVIKLCISFAYAVKNHLRNEFGLVHEDYVGILPASFTRFEESGYDKTYMPVSMSSSYASTLKNSNSWNPPKDGAKDDATADDGGSTPPTASDTPTPSRLASRRNISIPNARTPLLSESHRTVEFHAYAEHMTTPLPMLSVHAHYVHGSSLIHTLPRFVEQDCTRDFTGFISLQEGRLSRDGGPCRFE